MQQQKLRAEKELGTQGVVCVVSHAERIFHEKKIVSTVGCHCVTIDQSNFCDINPSWWQQQQQQAQLLFNWQFESTLKCDTAGITTLKYFYSMA